jgi:hypothetical protein
VGQPPVHSAEYSYKNEMVVASLLRVAGIAESSTCEPRLGFPNGYFCGSSELSPFALCNPFRSRMDDAALGSP